MLAAGLGEKGGKRVVNPNCPRRSILPPGVCLCPAGLPRAKKGPWHRGWACRGAAGPPCTELLSLRVLLVQELHQALTWRFVPSTKGTKRGKRGDRRSYSSSPPHSFSRAFLYSPEVSSWKDRWRTMWQGGSR